MRINSGYSRKAISTSATVAVIVVILVIAGVAAYFVLTPSKPSTTSTTSPPTTSTTSPPTTSTTSPPTTSTSSAYGPKNTSQLIDDSWGSAYDSLDPQYGFFVTDGYFANIFQGLVAYNGTDSNDVVPSIASNWTHSANYQTWTFTIRSGVTFSNGDPVNAYTAWFSFQRGYLLNAPLGTYVSNYPNLLENISNPCTGSISDTHSCVGEEGNSHSPANQVIWGTRQVVASAAGIPVSDNVVPTLTQMLSNFNPANSTQLSIMEAPNQGVQVINANTFQFNLLQAYPALLVVLPPQWGAFVDPVWIDNAANCGGVVNNTACTKASTGGMPGTGPYEYGAIGPSNSFVVLNANPNYWAKSYSWSNGTPSALCLSGETCQPTLEPPSIPTIVMNFGVSETTVIGQFDDNAVQMTAIAPNGPIGVPQFSELVNGFNNKQYATYAQLGHNAGYPLCDLATGLNGQVFPTNITDFRQAIVHAVNYSSLVQQLYTFQGQPLAELFQPPVPPGWGSLDNPSNLALYSYNLTLAAQYLNESGYQGNFFTVTTQDILNSAGQTVIAAGTVLGDASGQRLQAITNQYIVPLTPTVETTNEIQAAGLAELGVNINFQGITEAEYSTETVGALSGTFTGLPQMVGVGWCADFPDPMFQMFAPMVVSGIAGELSASVSNSTINTLTLRIPFESPTQALADSATVWAMFAQQAGILQQPNTAYIYFSQPYLHGVIYSSFQFAYYYNMMYYS